MLTARSVILAIVVAALLSVLGAMISLFWGGDRQSTVGRDSYGTRTNGYQAVYELLEELDYHTDRSLIPAAPSNSTSTSYVLWSPQHRLVQTEPSYFTKLAQWVREGGRLVVTPSWKDYFHEETICQQCGQARCECQVVSMFEELGLQGVHVEEGRTLEVALDGAGKSTQNNSRREDLGDVIREVFKYKERPTSDFEISVKGDWKSLGNEAIRVKLPTDEFWGLTFEETLPIASISIEGTGKGENPILAAKFPMGSGEIVVVCNPHLASNGNLGGGDNSVLLAHLLTGSRQRVVFDEFYHGLTVRGNALWLLSKRPYAVITTSILFVVGMWIWRHAIFLGPSRPEVPASRRSLGEYVEAMSRFMLTSRESARFVLNEVRAGVLWQFSKILGLPPQQQNTEVILNLLSRRQPEQAKQLEAALTIVDSTLKNPRASRDEILQATRKVSDCLST